MHTLFRKHNYRNIRLEHDTENETVGVLRRDGQTQQVRWLGFISRAQARQSGGRSVKLVISRVENTDLLAGQYVQGCLITEGVYALTDNVVVVIDGSEKRKLNSPEQYSQAPPFRFK